METAKKRGRPSLNKPKPKIVAFRLEQSHIDLISSLTDHHQCTQADLLRYLLEKEGRDVL